MKLLIHQEMKDVVLTGSQTHLFSNKEEESLQLCFDSLIVQVQLFICLPLAVLKRIFFPSQFVLSDYDRSPIGSFSLGMIKNDILGNGSRNDCFPECIRNKILHDRTYHSSGSSTISPAVSPSFRGGTISARTRLTSSAR